MNERHRTGSLRAAVAASLVAALLAAPLPAFAGEADQHFRRGVQLYEEKDHAAALVEFQRAYDIDPKYQVLFNIAESHYQLQDYASARRTFERYLKEGGPRIGFMRRKKVEAEIVTLSKRVATLTITTSEPGATVTVDDVGVGTTPTGPLTVSSGRRRVTATMPGRAPATQIVDLAGGDEKTIELDIPAPPAAVVTTEAPHPPPPPAPADRSVVPTVVMWSVTGALAASAVVTGVVALGASSDLEDELSRFPGDPDALASAQNSAFGFGLATDILIGTSVAAAAVATYFTVELLSSDDAASPAAASPAATPERASAARLVVRPGGVAVDGTF